MIKVHHLNNSRSQRVLWLLEELALPYEVVRYQRDPKTMLAPPELRAIHPLGKSPLVELDGQVLAESAAIIETLCERYDRGHALSPPPQPLDGEERRRYRYWMHYAEGSAMPPLLLSLVFSRIKSAPMPFFVKPIARGIADKAMTSFVGPQLALHLGYIESELGKHEWFAGERFTAADIQMSFPVEAAAARAGAGRPRMQAFVERIHARPAYQRALEKGGPYSLLG
ncbi:glutathione S-transferase [Lysobacter enzymogenes]|uniref:glutathione S-transferase n=1 Tax=Lysobacter enzymogenes TaxID=69 RepID=UPI001AF4CF4C|nr:glutathione S-transferase [Lysobacter enzymogenes]QQQ03243.1 glutathione S-transferase [Lysobacter enzymogenes]